MQAGETTERCVEYDETRRIRWAIDDDTTGFSRMVSDWRAAFSLEPRDGGTVVTAHSAFAPHGPVVRLMAPLVRRRFHHTRRRAILAALKRSVESVD